jgi:D-beta-D-heptose 7-phosphate kinase/D-beta-D-heptose 1-phosphate adenosyltransferase
MVDYVTIFEEPDPLNLIKRVRPDVLVKGEDWAEKGVVGREFVESQGGKVVLARLVEGQSSTSMIEKMQALEVKSR